jgi:glycosyltransferase 2 family protein
LARADKKISGYVFLFLKIGISSALLIYLFSKIGGMEVIRNVVLVSPAAFVAASLLYIATSYISSLRWRLFLPDNMGMRWIFSTYMIGAFFNVCLPSTIGGDAVKIYYLSRELSHRGNETNKSDRNEYAAISAASVFMDRYTGLAALLIIGMAGTVAGYQLLAESPVLWITPALFGAFVAGSILFFRFRFGSRIKFIMNMYDYFTPYFGKRSVIIQALLYSVLLQAIVVLSVYILARGLSIDATFLQLLVFVPLISLISLIPISISGLGLREGAYVFFLSSIGVRPDLAMTLSLLHFLSVVLASLWGFFEYLRFKHLFGGSMKEDSFKV